MLIIKMKVILKPASDIFISKVIFELIKEVDVNEVNKVVFNSKISLIKNIKKAEKFEEVKEEILKFVRENTLKDLKEKTEKIKEEWLKKEEIFFSHLKKIFNIEKIEENFFGYTTNLTVGNYGEDKTFVVRVSENIQESIFVIAEEITHLVYWDIWRKVFKKNLKNPWKLKKENQRGLSVWKISETIPEFVFKLNNEREKFYPWLRDTKRELKTLWENRKNFEDFLRRSHEGVFLNN
ncbi:MAG: hypothetical protein QW273_01965 [Candidatus Pacearchaeota archaeon]